MRDESQLKRFAARMRKQMTPAERHLWKRLSAISKCYAQMVVGSYIVDFAIPRRRLAIEVDGSAHAGKEGYDSERDAILARAGWRVVRFSNESVLAEVDAVVSAVQRALGLMPLPVIDESATQPRPRVGDAVQFGCAVRKWKRLHPPVPAVGRLVKK